MVKTNGTLAYRVDQLEKNYAKLDSKLDRLLTNELPHLQEELTSLKTRITTMSIMNIGALLLVGLLVYLLRV